MRTAVAGTLESMDCMVTATELPVGSEPVIVLEGSTVARFRTSMESTVKAVLSAQNALNSEILVQDHGALEIVLEARVETAVRRMRGER